MLAEHIWQVATWWDQRLQACFPVKFKKPSSAGTLSPTQSSLANTAGCRQPLDSSELSFLITEVAQPSRLMTKTKHLFQKPQW